MQTVHAEQSPEIEGLYIHIPFCRQVCPFCSFSVMKDKPERHALYFELLDKEVETISNIFPSMPSPRRSIYLGGGTPSCLRATELEQLVHWIHSRFRPARELEWTIEANPEDIDSAYARTLYELGFTRVSIGIQSFQDRQLRDLRRRHSARQARHAIETLLDCGFANLNLDLMFGYPKQTLSDLAFDLEMFLQVEIQHLSAYSLTIEPRTTFARKPCYQDWIVKHESRIRQMYEMIITRCQQAGLMQYEVSNFCLPGFESRHNLVYWNNHNYLGLGAGAHSHIFPHRWGNHKRLVDYKSALFSGKAPRQFLETITPSMRRDEDLMLALRLKEGLDMEGFTEKHRIALDKQWQSTLEMFKQEGFIESDSNRLILTIKGLSVADELSARLAACLPD